MTCDLGLLESDLRRDEGVEKSCYKDLPGNWTIGIGHLVTAQELPLYQEAILSDTECDHLLTADIGLTIAFLDHGIPWWKGLPEPAGRALANMAFQMRSKLFGFKYTLDALESGNFNDAAGYALESIWAKQTPERARRIADLFRSCAKAP